MFVTPVKEQEAHGLVSKNYQKIKQALNSATLPVFFTYLGSFPEYLEYLTGQLVDNLEDSRFKTISDDLSREFIERIRRELEKREYLKQWIENYKKNSEFYHFQKDLDSIILINIKLACIFISLREAVKGWAVAAKKLPHATGRTESPKADIQRDEFLYEYLIKEIAKTENLNESSLDIRNQAIIKAPSSAIEKNLLPEYLRLCDSDLKAYMKKDYFWILRVQLEEKILSLLATFPHLIFSPYNVIIQYTQKYDNFYELLYLLYEKFPTLSMHRLIFSVYMHI